MFKKEVGLLVLLRVFKSSNDSKWGAPSFAKHAPKKNQERILGYFGNLNKQLEHKLYPMHKINNFLFELKGFKYATSIDIIMVYYHI